MNKKDTVTSSLTIMGTGREKSIDLINIMFIVEKFPEN